MNRCEGEGSDGLGVPAPNARRRAIRSSPRCAAGYLLLSLTRADSLVMEQLDIIRVAQIVRRGKGDLFRDSSIHIGVFGPEALDIM